MTDDYACDPMLLVEELENAAQILFALFVNADSRLIQKDELGLP